MSREGGRACLPARVGTADHTDPVAWSGGYEAASLLD
jgi:hypothetical protein